MKLVALVKTAKSPFDFSQGVHGKLWWYHWTESVINLVRLICLKYRCPNLSLHFRLTSCTTLRSILEALNPFFALDIFICSFRKCIQHTTRGQSNFPLSKLCCCYIFIVLKYLWQNSITAHIYANCDQGIVTR